MGLGGFGVGGEWVRSVRLSLLRQLASSRGLDFRVFSGFVFELS